MDPVTLHRRSLARCRELVTGVRDDQWTASTPCADWDVRALVNHLTAEHAWAPPLLAGQTIEEVGDRYEGDLLGDDPARAHDEAAQAALEAVEALDDLERTVHLSFGDVPAAFYLQQRWVDLLVHGWDLAIATGQDATMDPEMAQEAYDLVHPMITDEVRASGIFGPEVPVAADADIQTRLLGFLGRRP